jgi:hypothetical protein
VLIGLPIAIAQGGVLWLYVIAIVSVEATSPALTAKQKKAPTACTRPALLF